MTDTSLLTGGVPAPPDRGASTPDLTPAAMLGGGARRACPSSPAPSGGGRIIRDPFAGYLEEALAEFIPHAGFAHVARRAIDGAASSVASSARSAQPEESHGTTSGYTYWRCRCDLCRKAMSIYQAERRLRLAGAR